MQPRSGSDQEEALEKPAAYPRETREAGGEPLPGLPPFLLFMNAAVGAASADVPIEDWMYAALGREFYRIERLALVGL